MVKILSIALLLLFDCSYTNQVCMCPSAEFGPFPRYFCGKEIRAIHPKNDCEFESAHRCLKASVPAEQRYNCSTVVYSDDKITKPLYRVCDFTKMHLDCTNSTCCDTHVIRRGCVEPFAVKGFNRYRLPPTANYAEERKAWYDDCLLNPKPKYSLFYINRNFRMIACKV